LAIAVLGVFWVTLRLLDLQDGRAGSSKDIGALVASFASKALGKSGRISVLEAVSDRAQSLPPLTDWQHPEHEFQRSLEVRDSARRRDVKQCLAASLDTLLAIAARHLTPQPYLEVGIPPDYLRDYPLNLSSFHKELHAEWQGLTVAQWAGHLAAVWGVEAHLRVALRKLNYESKDTFLLYATEEGIRRHEDAKTPRPGFTASRVNRAVQFLVDLGLAYWEAPSETVASDDVEDGEDEGDAEVEEVGDWVARITPMGREVREALDA
jgi:hypothetical protein